MSNDVTQVIARRDEMPQQPLAFISDIHSNLIALQAVLADIKKRGIEHIVCLGDVVGYGANPAECWQLVNDSCYTIIRGNHDQALGNVNMSRFHPRARGAIEWTRKRLLQEKNGERIIEDIANLPRLAREKDRLYVHGSPAGPTMDYLLPGDAFDRPRMVREFEAMNLYAFNGHTHIPGVVEQDGRFMPPEALTREEYVLHGQPAILNVGSVGQPRDGNPRACYLTLIDNVARYHRVLYDVEEACERILSIPDLDPFLGRRLLAGY